MKSATGWRWNDTIALILVLIVSGYIAESGTVQRFFETQKAAASDLAATLGNDAEILGLGGIQARDSVGGKSANSPTVGTADPPYSSATDNPPTPMWPNMTVEEAQKILAAQNSRGRTAPIGYLVQKNQTGPSGTPTIDMTPAEVRRSTWGEPRKISTHRSSLGYSESWYYKQGALIFWDGKLSNIMVWNVKG